METTLFAVILKDGRVFRVFCHGKSQIKRFKQMQTKLKSEINDVMEITNGIHTIKEFESIFKH